MELQYLSGVSHTLQTVAFATIIFGACVFLSQVNYRAQLAKLPALVEEGSSEKKRTNYIKYGKQLYAEGYEKFSDRIYRMATIDGVDSIVVPPQFLPELRKLPDSVLSFPKAVDEAMETKYTLLLTDESLLVHTVKGDLTPALARLNPLICDEVNEAMQEEMPACEDWTGIHFYGTIVKVVAKASGRVFVGPELCRDDTYLDAGINYTMEVMNAQRAVKDMRPWLRPFLAPRNHSVKALRQREQQATEFLRPIVQARRDAEKNDPDYQKPNDMLQWMLNRSTDEEKYPTARIARVQLGLTFAAIHTTSLTTTNVLYTLAVKPEYIQPLREEIRAAMAENDGVITSRALQSMEKLDSFMKETIRFDGLGFTSFSRKVLQGITLSNGQFIPPGVIIEVPSHAAYQDAANFPNPEEFDGFRFAKIRKTGSAVDKARNQFVSTNEQNLFFGYGAHACPGRFFAANEIKMILARIILEYDIKNAEGQTERIPNIESGRGTTPDATKMLMFRKVRI
ncbi:cytochrome P450 monooxygenase-like protein [Pleomassaria siparia CBS 279.74]|uniref:Cytochrome P450 monooxygenase-like protein n=1 Tax=Pleomassaria siparia CBS 279.74 TaxID=1314801 RepID=A0A6G1KI47_9PLEO|nr:cytochrome P450 monooxygenase-like protein [Pleomassaria siparia CBS 279.74]